MAGKLKKLWYSHGGTGKYGFESERMVLNSANLFIIINGEHLGTGAGTNGRYVVTKKRRIPK